MLKNVKNFLIFLEIRHTPADKTFLKAPKLSSDYLKGASTTSIAASEPKTILVIKDDAAFLNVLRISFRRKGYRVLTATDVSQAEEIWAMA